MGELKCSYNVEILATHYFKTVAIDKFASPLSRGLKLKILFYRKLKLVDEDLLEGLKMHKSHIF